MSDEKKPTLDLEELKYDRSFGTWSATFVAKSLVATDFKFTVSMSDSHSGDSDGYPPTSTAEVATVRLREKAHQALQALLEVSARNLRKSDELLPGASGQ